MVLIKNNFSCGNTKSMILFICTDLLHGVLRTEHSEPLHIVWWYEVSHILSVLRLLNLIDGSLLLAEKPSFRTATQYIELIFQGEKAEL